VPTVNPRLCAPIECSRVSLVTTNWVSPGPGTMGAGAGSGSRREFHPPAPTERIMLRST